METLSEFRTEIVPRKVEEASLLAEKCRLLDAFALKVTGNTQHPKIWGGRCDTLADGTLYNPNGITLERWSRADTVARGRYTKPEPAHLVGRLSIITNLDTTRAKKVLGADNCEPVVNLLSAGGWIVPTGQRPEILSNNDSTLTFVVPWPADIQTAVAQRGVSLDDLDGLGPANRRGRVVISADTSGRLITSRFGTSKSAGPDVLFHLLLSGGTGTGKTVLMLSMLAQLAQSRHYTYTDDGDAVLDANSPGCGLAIVDFKGGDGIGFLRNIPQQIGPTVTQDYDQARAVLAWFFNEIKARDQRQQQAGQRFCTEYPLYLAISEFTKLTAPLPLGIADAASIFMLSAIIKEGRSFNIHVIMDTQHVRGSLFGDTTIRSQLDDVVVFRPQGALDSAGVIPAALGVNPYLTLGKPGECYIVRGARVERGFAIHAPQVHLDKLRDSAAPQLAAWPEFDPNDLEGFEPPRDAGQPAKGFDAGEIAAALAVLKRDGDKKRALRDELGAMGNDRATALLRLARELATELDTRGYCAG